MAVTVESFTARGWSDRFVRWFVCSGLMFRGGRRAGDVLAAVQGVGAVEGVDPARLALAGWSHGSWAIMDLMTMRLDPRGEAGIADPGFADLSGVRARFWPIPISA